MRILRGLSSRVLPCGCLTGVYETYAGDVVFIVDARSPACPDPAHHPGHAITRDATAGLAGVSTPPCDEHPPLG